MCKYSTNMSLSSKLKAKPDVLGPPELKRQNAYTRGDNVSDGFKLDKSNLNEVTIEDEDEDEQEIKQSKFNNILFVADCPLSPVIKQELSNYNNIRTYDRDLFTNRNLNELLLEHDVKHIWVDINDKHARSWLGSVILKNDVYSTVLTYSSVKTQKWLEDLKEHSDIVVKIGELNKLKSLTMGELQDKMLSIDIHSPVSSLMACLGLKNSKLSKKKN